ncbi:hypothetical protein BCR21_03555 [Enterococcus ureasiticus]|uniref:Uncharacterized protein n=1 Tax=Enterococcus ureasiticus TaxID=903984 RepID=A0A1E5GMZ3_9ENTE|nr:hypothetical protein BCR21_03555 [Enterococcus ureasiticus]
MDKLFFSTGKIKASSKNRDIKINYYVTKKSPSIEDIKSNGNVQAFITKKGLEKAIMIHQK